MSYQFSDVRDEVKEFYDNNKNLMLTDVYYSINAITQESKEHFVTMLYDLVKAMNSVYKRASYYGFNNITTLLAKSMYNILDAMEEHINNRVDMKSEEYVMNRTFSKTQKENKDAIINYLNEFDEEV